MSPQSPATVAWVWASFFGCAQKKLLVELDNHYSFRPPPPPGEAQAQAQLLEIEDSLRLEVLETRSPS